MVQTTPANVRFISNEEMDRIFDQLAQYEFGLTGEEFLEKWERGDYDDPGCPDHSEAYSLAILRPVGR